MRHKEYWLTQDIKYYSKLKEHELKSAKRYKYLSIFTGTSTGIASIAALLSLPNIEQNLSEFYIYILIAINMGMLANSSYNQYTTQTKKAKKYHKKILKTQQRIKTINKTR